MRICLQFCFDFAFKSNMRRFTMAVQMINVYREFAEEMAAMPVVVGRGLHSSTFQLNLSRVRHTKTPYTP